MEKTMTKNEYQTYLKECANRFYTDKHYTKEDMNRDLDSVKILDFDLSKYPLIEAETKKWINILFKEDSTDRNGNRMLIGFTRCETAEMAKLNLNYGDYANGYSFYAYNDKERLIYTYCEGDTTLKPFETQEEYEKEKVETREWYKEVY